MRSALAALIATLAAAPAASQEVEWSAMRAPAPGRAEVIGSYANGCIAGASALPAEGAGYQVIRLGRERYWGHPDLVDFVEAFGRRLDAAGMGPALVGDLGQARGGPMPSGHRSHQAGLDVDIWLRLDLGRLDRGDREGLDEVIMVDKRTMEVVPGRWTDAQAAMIRLAAEDPRVARIFVHPAIKQALCEASGPDRSWLRRLRPWWGHDGHFHVRLSCPAGAVSCIPQPAPPPGDGCGEELATWLGRIAAPPPPGPALPPRPPEPLPAACTAVLQAAGG